LAEKQVEKKALEDKHAAVKNALGE